MIRQPTERRLAGHWVQNVLLYEIEPTDLTPRTRAAANLCDEAEADRLLNLFPVAWPSLLIGPQVRVAVRSHPRPQPSLFSHWIWSSGSQGLLPRLYALQVSAMPLCLRLPHSAEN